MPLVTQSMLQRQPNRTVLRSMDSYIQMLSRFQECKQKVPPNLLLSNEKSPFTFQGRFFSSSGEVKGDFSLQKRDGGGTSFYIFGICVKFG